ncbi:hypothetical protein X942_5830 [Burkholderia pseudomallei MSHR5596]|nr:hypothetical protein X942_5830 [Burkholderia pseudomallei MSHR5596]
MFHRRPGPASPAGDWNAERRFRTAKCSTDTGRPTPSASSGWRGRGTARLSWPRRILAVPIIQPARGTLRARLRQARKPHAPARQRYGLSAPGARPPPASGPGAGRPASRAASRAEFALGPRVRPGAGDVRASAAVPAFQSPPVGESAAMGPPHPDA